MFPTPVGKSFTCDDELSVELIDGDINAKVLLRKLKMQPFIFKNDFGPGKLLPCCEISILCFLKQSTRVLAVEQKRTVMKRRQLLSAAPLPLLLFSPYLDTEFIVI